ncbi:MAG TPA: RidA family protein [Pseudomonadales bacterium]|nr:RidA family protein [Pseudomonadales bacterium]
MAKEILGKPLKIGDRTLPLSAAVRANGFVFLSGQLGTDASFRLAGDDIASQTRQALDNVRGLLDEAGCSLADVVKVTAFITEASLSTEFNRVYAEFFPEAPPARSTIVCGLLIPGGLVEIEVVAAVPA